MPKINGAKIVNLKMSCHLLVCLVLVISTVNGKGIISKRQTIDFSGKY